MGGGETVEVLFESQGVKTFSMSSWIAGIKVEASTFDEVFLAWAVFLRIGVGGVLGRAFDVEKMCECPLPSDSSL